MNVTQLCATFNPLVRVSSVQSLKGNLSFLAGGPEDPCLLATMLGGQKGCSLSGYPLGRHKVAYQIDEKTLHESFLSPFVLPFSAGRGLVNGMNSQALWRSVPQPKAPEAEPGIPYRDAYCLLQNKRMTLPWRGKTVVWGKGRKSLAMALGGVPWKGDHPADDTLLVVCIRRKSRAWDDQKPWLTGAFPVWPRTLVVLECESALETASWKGRVDAILSTFTDQVDDTLLARVIRGEESPSGCLPYAMPSVVPAGWKVRHGCLVPADPWGIVRIPMFFGYRSETVHSFCFGHGLTYTTFRFDVLSVQKERVSFTVTNTGSRSAPASIQVYVQGPNHPFRTLRSFMRVPLADGESKRLAIPLDEQLFSFWDEQAWAFTPQRGEWVVSIGTSSEDIQLQIAVSR